MPSYSLTVSGLTHRVRNYVIPPYRTESQTLELALRWVSPMFLTSPGNGWVINDQGQVALTAVAPTVKPRSPRLTPSQCHVSQISRKP